MIENCEIPSADHTTNICLKCKKDYVLDQALKKCVEVTEFHKIDNCVSYLGLNHCKECAPDYYIKDGLCSALGNSKIDNCTAYNTDLTQCLACDSGKFLKANACEDIEKVDNCSLYSQIICDECKTDYLFEKNFYSSSTMNSSLAHQFILNESFNTDRVVPPPATVCIKQDIPHCLTYENFSFCGECDPGYYLDADRTCQKNPFNVIPNCKKYSDETTCVECDMEHFLAANECVDRTMVDDCEEYEITSSVCLQCSWAYYLDIGNNKCVQRIMSKHIEYCETRAISEDICAKCRNKFLPTTDNLACRYHVHDCNTYEGFSNFNTPELLCKICKNGLYPNDDKTECKPQDIINCHTYLPNSNTCVECNNGFYYKASDSTCNPKTALNCATSSTTEDKCLTCEPGFYLTIKNCVQYTIQNCKTPKPNADECDVCFDNHFKKDDNCFAYNMVGCLEFSPTENHCTKCNSGFYKTGNTCIKNNLLNCEIASATANECLKCEDGHYMTGNKCEKIYVPNCELPSLTLNQCQTGKCKDGFYLDTNKKCIKISQPNCKDINTTDGTCTTCEDGYIRETNADPCVPQYKPFCTTYTADTNDCTKCQEGYGLYNNSCYELDGVGCKTYHASNFNECTECKEGFFLKSNTCLPYTVNFCKTASETADECTECFENFLLHPKTKTCYIPDFDNCATATLNTTPTPHEYTCTVCMDGYGLNVNTNQCEPFHLVENCLLAEDFADNIESNTDLSSGSPTQTTKPFYKCLVCAYGYFADSGACSPIEAAKKANCRQVGFNVNECAICEDGYYPTSGACTEMAKDSTVRMCLRSGGKTQSCILCGKGYNLASATGDCTTNAATTLIDAHCLGNDTITPKACTVCEDGYSFYDGHATSILAMVENCVAWTGSNCTQCASGYKLDTTTAPNECVKFTGTGMKCAQKSATDTTALTVKTGCDVCANSIDFVNNSNSCDDRTKKNMENCDEYDKAADDCIICKAGTETIYNMHNASMCVVSNAGGTVTQKDKHTLSIANCLVYKASSISGSPTCLVCENGFHGDACDAVATSIDDYFDFATHSFITKTASAAITNASLLAQSSNDVQYMKCDDGYVGALDDLDSSSTTIGLNGKSNYTNVNSYDKITNEFTYLGDYLTLFSCVDLSTVTPGYALENDTTGTATYVQIDTKLENCALGKKDTATNVFFCIMCKAGYNPILVHNVSSDGTSANNFSGSTTLYSLACREKTDLFVKKYVGFAPLCPPNLTNSELLNFDSCANGDILVARIESGFSSVWKGDTTEQQALFCVPYIVETLRIENCHVYSASGKINPMTDGNAYIHCIACKPGYKAGVDLMSSTITSCTKIVGCDLSDPSKNTWMNDCETMLPGYARQYASSTYTQGTLVATTVENCELVSSTTCAICKRGYEMTNENKCVPISENRNGCQKYGMPFSNFQTNGTKIDLSGVSDFFETYPFVSLFKWIYRDYDTKIFGCIECSGSTVPIGFAANGNLEGCLETPLTSQGISSVISNCEKLSYKKSSGYQCSGCEDGYTIKNDASECIISKDKLKNCYLAASGDATCSTCNDGYQINTDGYCMPKGHCEDFGSYSSNTVCLKCKTGYRPDYGNDEFYCVKTADDDPCETWYLEYGCVKCKNGNTPITIYTDENQIIAKCTDIAWMDGPNPHAFAKYPFRIWYDNNLYKNDNKWATKINVGEFYDLTGTYVAKFCVPNFTIENCELYNNKNQCRQCLPGYYQKSPFECRKGSIKGCIHYSTPDNCSECGSAFYLNDVTVSTVIYKQCEKRTNTSCLQYNPAADECIKCHKGYYLNPSLACTEHSDLNCAQYEQNNNFCLTCLPGHKMNSDGICTPINHEGCMFLYINIGKCVMCLKGYYLDAASGECKRYTFSGCKIFKTTKDECIECESDHYLDVDNNSTAADTTDDKTKCKKRQVTGCLIGNPIADECYSCQPGMYLKTNITVGAAGTASTCKIYTVQNCSLFHVAKNECVDCVDGYFRDANKNCIPNGDPNCKIMGKYNQRCLMCNEGTYFDSTDNKCKLNTNNCKVFNPNANECFSCEDGLFYEHGVCKRYTAINCQVYSLSYDRCLSCIPDHYLNKDGNCLLSENPNCEIKQVYENSCIKCYSGYYLDAANKCKPYTVNNCKFYNPLKNACLTCIEGYYLNNSMDCKVITQKNCLGFVNNANKCATCQPLHYYTNGACNAYTVTHCDHYDQYADNCLKCKSGSYKHMNECKPYTAENCKTFDPDSDECASCDDDHFLSLGKCHDYEVENCEKYHPEADMCVECDDDYFRNGLGKCEEYTKVDNCETYNKYFNKCVECEEGYFMKDMKCVANPSGVYKCKVYATEEICAACEAPYYLKENQCVMSSTIIALCTYYTFDGNCGECDGNAFLISNQCHPTTNSTCASYSSPENCSKCAENEVLNTAGSTVICEASGIDNCMTAEYSTEPIAPANAGDPAPTITNLCKKCKPGYYLANNTCTEVTSITNCSEYESDTLCSKCAQNFILSKDKLSCSDIGNTAGSNCAVGRNVDNPECIVCKEGYFFDSKGVCTQCQIEGCAVCDVINLRKCKLCKSGYQMTELFYCETISSIQSNKPTVKRLNSEYYEEDNGRSILDVRVLFVAILVFLGLSHQ